mmetsp:Transcript_12274/g.25421  ORF Transcript_12274/g.25421 Transcript_12274/m.25421 type:complete len:511 (+) Transcript_12274:509-2041(+)
MVAEDFASSTAQASALYKCIRTPLISKQAPVDRKLSLVYVIDSLLKNVRGKFIPVIETDAKAWMPVVFEQMSEEQRAKLRRVWNTWRECNLFSEKNWEEMGVCFVEADGIVEAKKAAAEAKTKAAGIGRKADGSLDLSAKLREQMQLLLDEAQSEGVDELDKVSLERLADINPNLLVEIKRAAEDIVANGGAGGTGGGGVSEMDTSGGGRFSPPVSAFKETRSPEVIARAADWANLKLDHLGKAHRSISKLQHHVLEGCTQKKTYADEQDFATQMGLLVSASAGARYLTEMLETLKVQEDNKENGDGTDPTKVGGRFSSDKVDKSLFSRKGLLIKNPAVIFRLYDGGLPFVCAADGRRFATQLELTQHMDALFKATIVEKTMMKTEERGWYMWQDEWTGTAAATVGQGEERENVTAAADEDTTDPNTITVVADETRNRCLICGINFAMFFDHDEGEWMYKNCKEVSLLNDETAINETEQVFVHVTCLRGLGSPEQLTMDQVLQLDEDSNA